MAKKSRGPYAARLSRISSPAMAEAFRTNEGVEVARIQVLLKMSVSLPRAMAQMLKI